MEQSISELKREWEALKFELLTPATLTDEQWLAIQHLQNNFGSADAHRAIPFTVARFKNREKFKILKWACKQSGTFEESEREFCNLMNKSFQNDTSKIFQLFFNSSGTALSADCEIGLYRKSRAPFLHADAGSDQNVPIAFLVRLGNLPIEVIHGGRVAAATKRELELIAFARGKSNAGAERRIAMTVLRDLDILVPVPLGDVVMMLNGKDGTLHCSSHFPKRLHVPIKPKVSAFFRSKTFSY
jgi:hypothetical protein